MVSGTPLVLGVSTRMQDPYVDVAVWAPTEIRAATCPKDLGPDPTLGMPGFILSDIGLLVW